MTDLKKILASKNKILGRNRVIAALRQGKLSDVLLAKNCPVGFRRDIESLASIGSAKVIVLEHTNEELGIMCKKPFAVSAIGVKKSVE